MRTRIASLLVVGSSLAFAPAADAASPVRGGDLRNQATTSSASKQPSYRLIGDLEHVAGPNVWSGHSIQWFDKSPVLATLVDPAYYVLRPNGQGKATLTIDALSSASVRAVEVAIDRNNGFQLIAVGTTTDAAAVNDASPLDASAGAAALASGHKWGRYYTEWSDPFYIPVSSVLTWIDWNYSGGTVTNFTAGDTRYALQANGWHEIYNYFSKHWDRTETKGVADSGSRMQTSS